MPRCAANLRPYPFPTRRRPPFLPFRIHSWLTSAALGVTSCPFVDETAFSSCPFVERLPGTPTSQLTVAYPKMPNTNSLVNTRATLVNSRPSPSVGNAIRSQSLVNSRHHSSNAHASAPVPTSPLPSRMSPIVMQILLQTIRPTLVISRVTHVNTRHTLIQALVCSRRPPIPKIPQIMQILLQTIRPTLVISRVTHVNTRHTLIQALVCSRRPSHPENPQKSCKSSFRQPPKRS